MLKQVVISVPFHFSDLKCFTCENTSMLLISGFGEYAVWDTAKKKLYLFNNKEYIRSKHIKDFPIGKRLIQHLQIYKPEFQSDLSLIETKSIPNLRELQRDPEMKRILSELQICQVPEYRTYYGMNWHLYLLIINNSLVSISLTTLKTRVMVQVADKIFCFKYQIYPSDNAKRILVLCSYFPTQLIHLNSLKRISQAVFETSKGRSIHRPQSWVDKKMSHLLLLFRNKHLKIYAIKSSICLIKELPKRLGIHRIFLSPSFAYFSFEEQTVLEQHHYEDIIEQKKRRLKRKTRKRKRKQILDKRK